MLQHECSCLLAVGGVLSNGPAIRACPRPDLLVSCRPALLLPAPSCAHLSCCSDCCLLLPHLLTRLAALPSSTALTLANIYSQP